MENEGANVQENPKKEGVNTQIIEEKPIKTYSESEYSAILATNERLLEESRANKEKRRKAEERALELEGNKDKIIEQQRSELNDFRLRDKQNNIAAALEKEAKARGCKDWDIMYNSTGSDVAYDDESGQVSGVTEFFDSCEADERLKGLFFPKVQEVQTNDFTPNNNNITPKIDMRKDPKGYLRQVLKDNPENYGQEVAKMQRSGVIQ